MKKTRHLRWYILILVALGTLVNYVDRNTLGVLAPQLRENLHFTTEQYSFIVAAFQLSYSLMQPIAGFFIDLIGLRFGYFLFALLWGTAAVLHAFATSWQGMALFRGMLGIAEAAAIPGAVKTVSVWFPPKERSIAAGWFNTGSSVGAMITPPLVIWLAVTWDWQVAFLVTGAFAIVVACIWVVFFRTPERHPYLSAEEREYITEGQDTETLPKPSVLDIVRRRKFWGIAAARFLTEPAWQTFSFWIPLYMVTSRGMDIKQFALFAWLPFLGADLGCIVGGYLAPFFNNRAGMTLVNSRIAAIAVGAVCMIGPGLMGLVNGPITAILLFTLGGFAHQMLSSVLYALTTDTFPKQEVATATGLAGMAGYLGGTIFSLVLGQLANTVGYEPLFACLSVFDLLAVAIVWVVLGERSGPRRAALAVGAQ
jgi:ACS family hexuronate transporter-like MFS transporter